MIDKLEDIGFYTLCNSRAENVSIHSPMYRCEMILTNKCNFNCPYCRGLKDGLKKDMEYDVAMEILSLWIKDGLKNVRFSGGEPTLYPYLNDLVNYCRVNNVERIAVSSNGSRAWPVYANLLEKGVNDFSISLDACCVSYGDKMAGVSGKWRNVVANIRALTKYTYVTVGVVLTPENIGEINGIIKFAYDLGVADIRVIPAAQFDKKLTDAIEVEDKILDHCPILKYRINNLKNGLPVRGINESDCNKCHLVKDDSVVAGEWHFPCVIHLREGGDAVGRIGSSMRADRVNWFESHDVYSDPICRDNCLDVCVDYNNKVGELQR